MLILNSIFCTKVKRANKKLPGQKSEKESFAFMISFHLSLSLSSDFFGDHNIFRSILHSTIGHFLSNKMKPYLSKNARHLDLAKFYYHFGICHIEFLLKSHFKKVNFFYYIWSFFKFLLLPRIYFAIKESSESSYHDKSYVTDVARSTKHIYSKWCKN